MSRSIASVRASCAPALALLLSVAAPLAGAQSMDISPGYQPNGPQGGLFEVYQGDALGFQFSFEGATFEESLGQTASKFAFLMYSAATLPVPVPIEPGADLWLDPAALSVLAVPPTLTLGASWSSPIATTEPVTLPMQVAEVEFLSPTSVKLRTSDLIDLRFVAPLTQFVDEMRPLGVKAVGTSSTFFDAGLNRYVMSFDDGVDPVSYAFDLNDSRLNKGTLRIFESTRNMWVVNDGGFWYSQGAGQVRMSPKEFENFGSHQLLTHFLLGPTVVLVFQDDLPKFDGSGNVTRLRAYAATLRGRSLEVIALDLDPTPKPEDTYFGFSFENSLMIDVEPVSPVRVPYMDQIGISLIGDDYVSMFIDMFVTNAQIHNPATFKFSSPIVGNTEQMFYRPSTTGPLMQVVEKGFVTISKDIEDVFVETSAPPSTRANQMEELVMIGFTGKAMGGDAYSRDLKVTEKLVDWGLEDVLAWKVQWMNFGLNRRSTTHAPANPGGGSEQQFRDWCSFVDNSGWRLALYTDFYSLDQAPVFDDNPNYSEQPGNYKNFEDGVVGLDGEYLKGFQTLIDNSQQGGGDYFTRLLAPKRAMHHFEREAELFVNDYSVSAANFDVCTIATPDLIATGEIGNPAEVTLGNISSDWSTPNDRTISECINSYKNLFRRAGERVDGPTFGEGSFFAYNKRFDSFYAGYCDGVNRTLSTQGDPTIPGVGAMSEVIIPDYEISVVRPKMPGLFGMGVYSRFFETSTPGMGNFPLPDDALNHLRATQIAYMHNGFIQTSSITNSGGNDFVTQAQMVKEYYTMRSLQAEWTNAGNAVVEYRQPFNGAPWRSLNEWIKLGGYNFAEAVVRITYASGLVMTANHATVTIDEAGYQIPEYGWVVENPGSGYLNVSVLDPVTFQRYDEVRAPNYVLADGNGMPRDFGGTIGTTTDLVVDRTDLGFVLTEITNGEIMRQ